MDDVYLTRQALGHSSHHLSQLAGHQPQRNRTPLRSLTLQPPELLPQLGKPVRRRSSSRRPKARQPDHRAPRSYFPVPAHGFPCSAAEIPCSMLENSLFRRVGNSAPKPHDISGLGDLDPADLGLNR